MIHKTENCRTPVRPDFKRAPTSNCRRSNTHRRRLATTTVDFSQNPPEIGGEKWSGTSQRMKKPPHGPPCPASEAKAGPQGAFQLSS